jgi:HAD superfamily hydrolase (TIGR01490 family)
MRSRHRAADRCITGSLGGVTQHISTPPQPAPGAVRRGRAAAFFDVDRTLLRGSSFLALAAPLRCAGLISRRRLLAAALHQLRFTLRGASSQTLEETGRAGAEAVRGIEAARLRQVTLGALDTALLPRLHTEALRVIDAHHRAEEPVFLVSSAPVEIVEPLGRAVGATDVAATRAEVRDGRYTGRLETFVHGPAKYHAVHELAARHGIDLLRSHAYADSFSDAPMLGAVGHPVAVNPDAELRALARRRGWRIERYRSSRTSSR